MSFDAEGLESYATEWVSIPFEQGDVFRHNYWSGVHQEMEVSIPFEQGDVFRQA